MKGRDYDCLVNLILEFRE